MNPYLKADASGRMTFSPWGDTGAAYFLPDRATHQRATHLLTLAVWAFSLLPMAAVVRILPFVWLAALLPLFLLWYATASRSLVRGLTVARERPPFRDYCARSSDAVGFPFLVMIFIFTLPFAWGSAWALSRGHLGIGIFGTLLFGGFASFCSYLLRVKWERTRETKRAARLREKAG